MQRDHNKTVTGKCLAILLPSTSADAIGSATFLMELGPPQPVRLFNNADIARASQMRGTDADRISALVILRNALDARDPLQLEKAVAKLEVIDSARARERNYEPADSNADRLALGQALAPYVGTRSPDEALMHFEGLRSGPRANVNLSLKLSYEVSKSVAFPNCQLVLWWNQGSFQPAIFCSNLHVAFCVHTFFIAPTGSIGVLTCPHCTKQFLQDRTNQLYCCPEHREAHRIARHRAKKKALLVPGGANGTDETR